MDVLSVYPYRDDGKLVWKALESWVRSYVDQHYRSDGDIAADGELQAMVRQVGQRDARDAAGPRCGGGIRGVGEDGPKVATRDYLTKMITQLIWNGSAQHAAVNFPQADPMAYAPRYPLAADGTPTVRPSRHRARLPQDAALPRVGAHPALS